MHNTHMKEETLRYNLKMTVDLHATLIERAKKNKRSLQAEIIQRLEDSLVYEREDIFIQTDVDGGTTRVVLPHKMTRDDVVIELKSLMTNYITNLIDKKIKAALKQNN